MKIKKSPWLIIANTAILLFILSCEKDSNPTPSNLPELSTTPLSSITSSSALSGGIISIDRETSFSSKGVAWSTSSNPTISLPTKTSDGIGVGIFTSTLTELAPSTLYFVRAYATGSFGTAYGNEISFTTVTNLPTLITTQINSSTLSAVSTGGTISNDGGSAIGVRGVVWGTSPNPTISLSTKTTDGTGIGSFKSSVTGLVAGVPYFIRAYATNGTGTAYGNTVRWKFSRGG